MEGTKVRDHSKATTFVYSSSSSVIEQMEMSTTQDVTTNPSAKKNKVKRWLFSSQDDTSFCCCCNISPKIAKWLELSGLITGIVIVSMLFSIPIISYFVQVSEDKASTIIFN